MILRFADEFHLFDTYRNVAEFILDRYRSMFPELENRHIVYQKREDVWIEEEENK